MHIESPELGYNVGCLRSRKYSSDEYLSAVGNPETPAIVYVYVLWKNEIRQKILYAVCRNWSKYHTEDEKVSKRSQEAEDFKYGNQ